MCRGPRQHRPFGTTRGLRTVKGTGTSARGCLEFGGPCISIVNVGDRSQEEKGLLENLFWKEE